MATKTFTVKFVGTVAPKKTKYLASPKFDLDVSGTLDLDETDASKFNTIQKEFTKAMNKHLKTQLGHLDGWLKEKNKLVEEMVTKHEAIKKFGFPSTASDANALAAKNKALVTLAEQTQKLKDDYTKIVNDWAQNARKQWPHICLPQALKNARTKTLQNKSWRVRAGMAIKITLIVLAVALSIAAIVLTAGATAPIFVGLAAAGIALSGASSIAKVGVMIKDNANIEKKILENVKKDVQKVTEALKPLDKTKSSLAKHVTEMQNVMKVRLDSTKQLKTEIHKKKVEIGGYDSQLKLLRTELAKQSPPDKKMLAEIASREKKIVNIKKQIGAIDSKMAKMEVDNKAAQALLDELKDMNIQLEKISGQSANTVASNLKERFSSSDGWISLGEDLGGLAAGVSGAHA
jgi:hypothetical protein